MNNIEAPAAGIGYFTTQYSLIQRVGILTKTCCLGVREFHFLFKYPPILPVLYPTGKILTGTLGIYPTGPHLHACQLNMAGSVDS